MVLVGLGDLDIGGLGQERRGKDLPALATVLNPRTPTRNRGRTGVWRGSVGRLVLTMRRRVLVQVHLVLGYVSTRLNGGAE